MSLVLTDVQYAFAGAQLIDGVSAQMNAGTVTTLIGPNGAGKTTLLRIASGEISPTAGTAMLDGESVGSISLEDRARRFGFLTQQSALDFPFTVREVMAMGRIPHLSGREKDDEVITEVVDVMALAPLIDRVYTTLSGGEKQRIQIGRILCQIWGVTDAVILFDEPTSALDLSHQLAFFELAQTLAQSGATVLIVVHDVNLASRFSDNIVLMAEGVLIASGSPLEVVSAENISRAFAVEVDLIGSNPERPVIQAVAPLHQVNAR